MDKNRTEGVEHGFKRTMKEMMGGWTDNKREETAGNVAKTTAKAEKKMIRAADDTRDTARTDDGPTRKT